MSFDNTDEIEEALKSPALSIRDLYAAWERRKPITDPTKRKAGGASRSDNGQISWLQDDLSLASEFTKRALKKEEFLLVCDAAREVLWLWPGASPEERLQLVDVRMHYAAALTRLGFTVKARRELEPCASDDFQPKLVRKRRAEILFQLGNILREESQYAAARATQFQTGAKALEFYRGALEIDPSRIDIRALVAAASLVLADHDPALRQAAREQAEQVLVLASEIEASSGTGLGMMSARAVALTVLGQIDEAANAYGELQKFDDATVSFLADRRHYAQFLAEALGKPRDFFKKAFPPLQLIVFSGHLPDREKDAVRFPHENVAEVTELIRQQLDLSQARVGLVGAAAGADLLFADALHKRGGAVHVVLPWAKDEFLRSSVRPFEPSGQSPYWEPLFENAIREAATIREVGQSYAAGSDVGWTYMMEVTAGLALHTARVSRLDVVPMVLWDQRPGRGVGAFVNFWRHHLQREPIVLDLPVPKVQGGRRDLDFHVRRSEMSTLRQEVKSMLFADIVGYSKLTESVIPEFVGAFLERVSQLMASSKHPPRSLNMWGDAVYAVFDFASDAGSFALELTQMIQEGKDEWIRNGLYWEESVAGCETTKKHPLNIRVGLHAGPVFVHYNPVVRQLGYTGGHVNRAARIEPIANHGEVFASEEFAALAELGREIQRHTGGADGVREGFVCDYAGSMQLAKSYPGRHRIYRVVPKRELEEEELARSIHESYCAEAKARGETRQTNAALVPWENLEEDLKKANRAQAADIPNKLLVLEYELAPSYGIKASEISITDAQVETMAIREHDRWMEDRIRNGWKYAPIKGTDHARKQHPLLVPWEQLSEPEKEKDRDTVRNLPRLIEKAGFRVRKIADAK